MYKTLKGYVSSRSILGQIVPQSIQNTILRSYCNENNFKFALSSTEYSPEESFLMLEKTIKELDPYHGIISYSIFQLPYNLNYRNIILNKIINKKKIFYFVIEKICIKDKNDIINLNQILKINQLLPYSLDQI
tara:strand:- start:61 stop:459 length:399 start_codon:yes stop_codon:yes gene_type:complete